MADLQHLVDMGDRRALMFIVYEANRGRSPAKRLVQLVRRSFEQATEPRAVRPAADGPARAASRTRWRATASIRWARPMPPPPASPTSSAPRPAARRSARRRARRRPRPRRPPPRASPLPPPSRLPALTWSASGEPIAPPGYRIVWVPRHPGVPDLPDELPLSPIARLARDFPDFADWFIRRGEERLAELAAEPRPSPSGPRRSAGQKPLGP